MRNLYQAAFDCLMTTEVKQKLLLATKLYNDWQQGLLSREEDLICPIQAIPVPGRPNKPELIHPKLVKHRRLGSVEGQRALLHAVAHIEFNAINLAVDAVYRFHQMPDDYYGDWLKVAAEEAYHFTLLNDRLADLNCVYGDLPAHNGLWEQACKTDHDVMVRMALVPRVLEARGLDVTPSMMERLKEIGDTKTVSILEIILRDEIGHVRIGSHWFKYCCEQRQFNPETTFRRLIQEIMQVPVRGPFYTQGRLQAGFSKQELEELLDMEKNWQGLNNTLNGEKIANC